VTRAGSAFPLSENPYHTTHSPARGRTSLPDLIDSSCCGGGISYTLEGTLRGPIARGYFVASEGFRVEHVE
jgi:hypothetical protein